MGIRVFCGTAHAPRGQADRETHTLHIASLEVHVAQLQRRETVLVAEMSALREQLAALHAEKELFLEQARPALSFGGAPDDDSPPTRPAPCSARRPAT